MGSPLSARNDESPSGDAERSPLTIATGRRFAAGRKTTDLSVYFFAFLSLLILSGSTTVAPDSEYMFQRKPARIALVIGNSAYQHQVGIPSAALDVERLAGMLKDIGFVVVRYENVTMQQFEYDILPAFAKRVDPGKLALFFFSGHGFAYGGSDYLAPVDLPQTVQERDLALRAIPVEDVEDYLTRTSPGLLLFLLDSCRDVPNFVVTNRTNNNALEKGFRENQAKLKYRYSNVEFGYAARIGRPAQGSDANGVLSLFSDGLVHYLGERGPELHSMFKDVMDFVLTQSQQNQQPGITDYSVTDLYLNPIATQETEAWSAALSSHDPDDIARYSRRNAMSIYSAAARKWLADNPKASEPSSKIPAVAVERDWSPNSSVRLGLRPSTVPFAFERTSDVFAGGTVALSDEQLGLVRSGGSAEDFTPLSAETGFESNRFRAAGEAITTADLKGHSAPSFSAPIVARVPYGTKLKITSVKSGTPDVTWISAINPSSGEEMYLPAQAAAPANPVELGKSLREVIVPGIPNGLRDLVDKKPIMDTLGLLKRQRDTITWVSIAAGKGKSAREDDELAARIVHAEYVLTLNGVSRQRITAVRGVPDLPSDYLRVRFFGYNMEVGK
jgi:hypothetical protein